jgi:hypothetical protein
MTIYDIFKKAVALGIKNDFRPQDEALDYYWREIIEGKKGEKFINPYADTGVVWTADLKKEIKIVVLQIDLDINEIIAIREKYKKEKILFLVHHPQGRPDATFPHILKIQLGNLKSQGVNTSGLVKYFDKIVEELVNETLGSNPDRLPKILRLLNCDCLAIHTPIDNLAARYMERNILKSGARNLKDCLNFLLSIPEYSFLSRFYDLTPKIFSGRPENKLGKVLLTEFTGGEEGPVEIFKAMKRSGVDTIIVMHMSAKAIETAKKLKLNVICAGDIGSDSIGLNLFCDLLEKENIKIIAGSGFTRVIRN